MSWDSKERREFVRLSLPLKIYLSKSKHYLPAKTKNISAGGIRLVIAHKLKNGLKVTLKIYNLGEGPLICEGEVLWSFSRKIPYSKELLWYDTGIEFYKIKKKNLEIIKKTVAGRFTKE